MADDLRIIQWPDARLKQKSVAVTGFDASLRDLAARMLGLMREARGVGLAAPQVGRNVRLFVMNPTGEEGHERVYVNPELREAEGAEEAEEGCLSLPGINIKVVRSQRIVVAASDAEGNPVEQELRDFPARVWQHEFDHLNGMLLTDRMGPVARMTYRRILKELQEEYEREHPPPPKRKGAASRR